MKGKEFIAVYLTFILGNVLAWTTTSKLFWANLLVFGPAIGALLILRPKIIQELDWAVLGSLILFTCCAFGYLYERFGGF